MSGQLFRVGPTVTVWDKDQWFFFLHPFCNYPEYQARCTHGNRRGRRVEGGSGWVVAALQFPLSARNACPPLLIANTTFLSPLQQFVSFHV